MYNKNTPKIRRSMPTSIAAAANEARIEKGMPAAVHTIAAFLSIRRFLKCDIKAAGAQKMK
jgi:hypothetical protein